MSSPRSSYSNFGISHGYFSDEEDEIPSSPIHGVRRCECCYYLMWYISVVFVFFGIPYLAVTNCPDWQEGTGIVGSCALLDVQAMRGFASLVHGCLVIAMLSGGIPVILYLMLVYMVGWIGHKCIACIRADMRVDSLRPIGYRLRRRRRKYREPVIHATTATDVSELESREPQQDEVIAGHFKTRVVPLQKSVAVLSKSYAKLKQENDLLKKANEHLNEQLEETERQSIENSVGTLETKFSQQISALESRLSSQLASNASSRVPPPVSVPVSYPPYPPQPFYVGPGPSLQDNQYPPSAASYALSKIHDDSLVISANHPYYHSQQNPYNAWKLAYPRQPRGRSPPTSPLTFDKSRSRSPTRLRSRSYDEPEKNVNEGSSGGIFSSWVKGG